MRRVLIALSALAFAMTAKANATEFSFQGYADFRAVIPVDETSWIDGGLGKLRYGMRQPTPNFRFAEAVGQGSVDFDNGFHAVVIARVEPEQRDGVDALQAYVAYRPSSQGDWQWSAKAGAFFPPFSLENNDLGWTSPYTLTPSAINSWVGDELRTLGGEATVQKKTSFGSIALVGSVFCCNDPAGVLIADRGWTLDDRPTGLLEKLRLPNATLLLFGQTAPGRTPLFREIDNRAGWYAGATWAISNVGKASLYRYDNDGNSAAVSGGYSAWRTRFWSAGWETHLGRFSLLAQGLTGDTAVTPFPAFVARTEFESAYLLAAYDIDSDWRVAARAETFRTHRAQGSLLNEDGHAFTASLSWMPHDWLRVTGEVVDVISKRGERVLELESPEQSGAQWQLDARFYI